MTFNQLRKVQEAAEKAAVSFSLHFCESDSSWYYAVSSTTTTENRIGKDRSFDSAIDNVLAWVVLQIMY